MFFLCECVWIPVEHVLFETPSCSCVYLQFHMSEPKARNMKTDIMNTNIKKERQRKSKAKERSGFFMEMERYGKGGNGKKKGWKLFS